ncbi:hypothetical protein ACRB68_37710 [Actinomadura sp. RB68]|uniref:Uncharacterized protein n=1 Tax=Actinomadura macrotermitis TaxID=2585200 RepID=A0A7K0BYI0_9ACTN|nr:hypothetical protein [Actinomadura macrotermitis]
MTSCPNQDAVLPAVPPGVRADGLPAAAATPDLVIIQGSKRRWRAVR